MIHCIRMAMIAMLALAPVLSAQAQSATPWPAKAIRMIIPVPPGGTSDILARMLGQKLTETWGQQIVVESRPGANGNIGVELLVRSPPDGYTLCLMDVGNLSISPAMYTRLPFDILRDLTPVTMVSYSTHLVTVHPSVPVKNVGEVIALAKKNPGKLNFPTALGSAAHLAGLLLQQRTGAQWVYVPTKGGQSSILTVATGEGDLLFMGMLQTMPHVRAGRVRALAVTGSKRSDIAPQLPTMIEAGVPGYEHLLWNAVLVPAATPKDAIARLDSELSKVVAAPDLRERFAAIGTDAISSTPEQYAAFIKTEMAKYARIIKSANIRIEH